MLPRLRPLTRYLPPRYRRPVDTALPDRGVLAGGRGALGRHRRTFMIEQRALTDELPAVTAPLGRLDLPVAVVTGGRDLVVPPGSAAHPGRQHPRGRADVLPEAGHFVARDDPEALAEVVRRWALPSRRSGIDPG